MLHHILPKPTPTYVNKTYQRRAEHQPPLCIRCGSPDRAPGLTLCEVCRERARSQAEARLAEVRVLDLCHQCGVRPRQASTVVCKKCQARDAARQVLKRQRARELGQCTRCTNRPQEDGGPWCSACVAWRREYERHYERPAK